MAMIIAGTPIAPGRAAMNSQEPIWQVNADGQIYEADLETLKRWIAEGRLLATDSVRKGALNWIAANRAPALRGLFPEGGSLPSRPVQSQQVDTPVAPVAHTESVVDQVSLAVETKQAAPAPLGAPMCHNHSDRSATYSCRICGKTFCDDCPQSVGSSRILT